MKDDSDLACFFKTKLCENISFESSFGLVEQERFNAERIVALLRAIAVLISQGAGPSDTPRWSGYRRITSLLVDGGRQVG